MFTSEVEARIRKKWCCKFNLRITEDPRHHIAPLKYALYFTATRVFGIIQC